MAERDARLTDALLRWYPRVARDLPWRRTRDPYAIWVSEVMLQQTRVETVVPYYQRFMQRWPDAATLAAASLDDVLVVWSGLGYYRRARQLHLAASEVVERFAGELPTDARQLRTLSGIGPYTAGAIASIAFDQPEPLVDGNVVRVLSRAYALSGDMRVTRSQRVVWQVAGRLVPERGAGTFNQALMELGATLCTPKRPDCHRCPIVSDCQAHTDDAVELFPQLGAKRPPKPMTVVAAVLARGDRRLLARREPDGLYGGLWEPPMVEANELSQARPALGEHGVPAGRALRSLGRVRHVLTHRALDVIVAGACVERRWRLPRKLSAPYNQLAWRVPEQVALSTLARKVLSYAERSLAAGSTK